VDSAAEHLRAGIPNIQRQREDDGGVLLHADLRQGLEVAELDTDRLGGQQFGRIHQALRGRKFALRVDDLGALFAFRFGLLSHGTQHGLRHVHLLDLDVDHLHAPGPGVEILRTMFAFGVIDHPPMIKPIDAEAGAAVAQRVEEQGAVLLKNAENELPLKAASLHSIAVIGSHADVGVLSGGGSAQVEPIGGNAVSPQEIPPGPTGFLAVWVWDPSSPLRAIRAKDPNAKVNYDDGTDSAAAAKLAGGSDLAIVFVHQHTYEDADLPNLSLPDNQDELIKQVAATNSHTIVVLENGDPILMPWLNSVKAVLESWYPGQRGGEAIANILFGDVNPSGKLPISFPKSEADLPHLTIPAPPPSKEPPSSDLLPTPIFIDANYTEGLKVGYRWYDAENKEPLFPFGFGLSYTSFSYSQLKVTSGKSVEVSFSVQNTGLRGGAEVAQVYLGLPASAGEPPKRLVAWEKVQLDPSQSRTVTVSLEPQFMSVFNVEKDAWELIPGDYLVSAGGSSRYTPLTATLHIPVESR
jgi:beta-glucosidase